MSTELSPPRHADRAQEIRLRFAAAWGSMGASWGIAPAVARVHGYLMARGEPLTEREVREALDMSHRAASMALEAAVGWGIVEKVPEPRRVGSRGPAGTAYVAVGDHFRWFSQVIARRKALEGDPIVAVLAKTLGDAEAAVVADPDDPEVRRLRDWLVSFLDFVRLFDRAIGLVPAVAPADLQRVLGLLAKIPDESVLRLVGLMSAIPDDDVLTLINGVSRMRPATARRATRLMIGVVRAVGR